MMGEKLSQQQIRARQKIARRETIAPPNPRRWGEWIVGKLQAAPPADAPIPRPRVIDTDLNDLETRMSQLLDPPQLQDIGSVVLTAEQQSDRVLQPQ